MRPLAGLVFSILRSDFVRDSKLSRIHNAHGVRYRRYRGEAERTNSVISDFLVDGATLDWERYQRFEDLSEEQIKQTSPKSYEEYEKKRMEKNG